MNFGSSPFSKILIKPKRRHVEDALAARIVASQRTLAWWFVVKVILYELTRTHGAGQVSRRDAYHVRPLIPAVRTQRQVLSQVMLHPSLRVAQQQQHCPLLIKKKKAVPKRRSVWINATNTTGHGNQRIEIHAPAPSLGILLTHIWVTQKAFMSSKRIRYVSWPVTQHD